MCKFINLFCLYLVKLAILLKFSYLALSRFSTLYRLTCLYLFLTSLLASCSLEKESALNRGLQNLTAHYNILFNANEILRQKQESYEAAYVDDYDQLLSAYPDTTFHSEAPDKDLDAAIAKANAIISTKDQSHYIGDAYLVLGKANYLYGHYFNAVEFFKYVTLSFIKRPDLVQQARVWQARSLIYLNQLPQAKAILDSVMQNINPKKSITADAYATAMQYHINRGEYAKAETIAKLAVKNAHTHTQRLRWTFMLAQLQELNKEPQDADMNYNRVMKSNASFELAFNANLNHIRLEEVHGNNLSRMKRLRLLLRDDKNRDFIDQIYYNIALLYLADNDTDNAVKNLQLSVRKSTRNQNQKGLSYLRLADINFKYKADFAIAKKYYDSTLLNLSPNYPDYALIKKKSDNLQVLADRLNIIAREDTLQLLAKLNEAARAVRIEEMARRHAIQLQQAQAQSLAGNTADPFNNTYAYNNNMANTGGLQNQGAQAVSTFYFYNPAAVSQGFSDFKRIWGNRKLQDNWRRSKSANSTSIAANPTNEALNGLNDPYAIPGQPQANPDQLDTAAYKQHLIQNLPLTPQLLEASNKRLYNAYTDIGNFYRDVLKDDKDAIEPFETVLRRFPDDPNKPAIYYNLYRLYSDIDQAKSDEYKNRLLRDFPSSIYAKVITDPDYSKRMDDKDAEFNALYSEVYDLYADKKYPQVISKADSLLQLYPDSKFSAQLAYLRAISNGHREKLEPFRNELSQITTKYNNDLLITPLVNQHMIYIEANKAKMAAREFALMDNDPNEEPFIPPTVPKQVMAHVPTPVQPAPQQQQMQVPKPAAVKANPAPTPAAQQVIVPPAATAPPAIAPTISAPVAKPVEPPSIFSLRDSTHYYFVVNVNSGTTNLASSRFGIGQFNRTHYQGSEIRHQLKDAGPDNQLIYVGRFNNLASVKAYSRAIIPLMPQIMTVPANKYMFFIITQENLDKLADKKTLDSYIDFYQKNY
jgi:hypothetical protein